MADAVSLPVFGMLDTAMEQSLYRENMRQSHEWYEDDAERQFLYNQTAQRMAARNNVEGLKMAGLSPAMLDDGKFSPAGATSAPNMGASPTQSHALAGMMAAIQARQADAQTKLIEEQARGKQLENDDFENENASVDEGVRRIADEKSKDMTLSEEERNYWQTVLDNPRMFSAGSLRGFDKTLSAMHNDADLFQKRFVNGFEREMIEAKRDYNVPEWLAKMPEREFREISVKIGNLMADTTLKSHQSALTTSQARKIDAEISKILQELKNLYHADPASMWENGDFKALIGTYLDKFLNKGIEVAGDVAASYGSKGRALPKIHGKRESTEETVYDSKGNVKYHRERSHRSTPFPMDDPFAR